MYQEYETFILRKQLPEENKIKVGMRGVILMVLNDTPPVYVVEFPDGNGSNTGDKITYDLTEDYMQRIVEDVQ